jgi:hypothetical protein
MSIHLATIKSLAEIAVLLEKYNAGMEIQCFIDPQNLDNPGNIMMNLENCIAKTMRN